MDKVSKGKRLAPKRAIRVECCLCQNSPVFHGCTSEACKLNDQSMSNLKKIKAHCITCVPEQSIHGVKKCDGKVSSPYPHLCNLHQYRLGHNPARKGMGGAGNFAKKALLTNVKTDFKRSKG